MLQCCIFVINYRCFTRIYPDFVWHFKLWNQVTNAHLSPGFWKVLGWDEDLLILELIFAGWWLTGPTLLQGAFASTESTNRSFFVQNDHFQAIRLGFLAKLTIFFDWLGWRFRPSKSAKSFQDTWKFNDRPTQWTRHPVFNLVAFCAVDVRHVMMICLFFVPGSTTFPGGSFYNVGMPSHTRHSGITNPPRHWWSFAVCVHGGIGSLIFLSQFQGWPCTQWWQLLVSNLGWTANLWKEQSDDCRR